MVIMKLGGPDESHMRQPKKINYFTEVTQLLQILLNSPEACPTRRVFNSLGF
jgi:hypothetical protein